MKYDQQISEYNNPLFKQCYTGEEWLCMGRHKTIKLLDRKTLPVIIGWLTVSDEATVVGFPRFVTSFKYKNCAGINSKYV